MSALHDQPAVQPGAVPVSPAIGPKLRMAEILASPRRLWLRGRLDIPAARGGWFSGWWGSSRQGRPREFPLETRIGNRLIQSVIIPSAEGYFEARLEEEIPPARRGWRVARNRLTCGDGA